MVRNGSGERDSIGVADAPVGVEEDNNNVIEGPPCQGLAEMEVVRLSTLDVAAGDTDPLSIAAPEVVGGATADISRRKPLGGPFTSAPVGIWCHDASIDRDSGLHELHQVTSDLRTHHRPTPDGRAESTSARQSLI